jgi:DNA-binding transcriptional LysR family regulator
MAPLEGLAEFAAVAETGGFSRAAARLGISTAQVSRQVAALEARLGARLFARTTRSVRLTEAGTLLWSRARGLLEGYAEACAEVGDAAAAPRGLVRIAAGGAYGERLVARALIGFAAAHPAIRIELAIADRRIDLAAEGFDLAVRLGALDDSSLIARKVAQRRRVLCAAPAYLAGAPPLARLEDLAAHARLGAAGEEWRLAGPDGPLRLAAQGPFLSNSIPAQVAAAVAGLGLLWLAEDHVQEALAAGRLVRVLEQVEASGDPVWLVYPARAYLPARTRSVIDWLAQALA